MAARPEQIALARNILASLVAAALTLCACHSGSGKQENNNRRPEQAAGSGVRKPNPPDGNRTEIYVHNVLLRKGTDYKVLVRWLRGNVQATRLDEAISLDDPNSFAIHVDAGVLGISLVDLGNYLNAHPIKGFSVSNLKFSTEGKQIQLTGTFHKVLSLPVKLIGDLLASDDKIIIRVRKLDLMKIPLKGLLSGFHIKTANLFSPDPESGVTVKGDDIHIDTGRVLPAPHFHGSFAEVHLEQGDIVSSFGNAREEVQRSDRWKNFLQLQGGRVRFGKLTMDNADMTMIDSSPGTWFDLDFDHYQRQLIYGYSRITADAGLEIYMPDVEMLAGLKNNIGLHWPASPGAPAPSAIAPHSK